ncbi:hypothetical protein [Yoonia litorea]|uniref:Uncharacterized protein n=1 Tax=Yoonia litorea TaxID=1123755 RepID=A0A1I6LT00_9RHOB|nr:hypothetical protein [Yoonia litorea]SFS06595.1 hypothetical protein SAMN05444714_0868 [Yoonia litorea]
MHIQWPSFDQMTYRVMRLRRLLAVAMMIPLIGLLSVSWAYPDVLSAAHASIAACGLALLLVAHVVIFPNVTLETLALAFAATGLVVIMPLIKALAVWAPVEQQSGALLLLVAFAVALCGVVMILCQILLGGIIYAGPTVKRVMVASQTVECSAKFALQQLSLAPNSRRGRLLAGEVDDNGFFDVAVATMGHDGTPECIRVDAKVLESNSDQHDVMLISRSGAVTVTSLRVTPVAGGASVEVRDMPGDFTLGMYLLFWLTDQQADTLTEMTDLMAGREGRANGLSHHISLTSVAGALLSPRAPMID